MRSGSFSPAIVFALTMLPVLYVAAYLALYDPQDLWLPQVNGRTRIEHYRYGGRVAELVFAPLEYLDWRQ